MGRLSRLGVCTVGWLWGLGVALAALAGCHGSTTSAADLAPPASRVIKLQIGPLTLPPGAEQTLCITAFLPNVDPIDVVQIDSHQLVTHHVIFYREMSGTVESLTPTPCPPLDVLSQRRAPLFIGETPDATMKLPPGVAYHLAGGAPYRIEGHFLNASTSPASASAEIDLTLAPSGSVMQEADMLFLSAMTQLNKNYDGNGSGLPPMTTQTIDPAFWALPVDMNSSNIFALTSHMHRLGTDFVIAKSTDLAGPGSQIFRTSDWEHPPLLQFPDAAPLTFLPGEGFRWDCTYNNTGTSYVKFGQSAQTNEMCILWAYYYPSQGFRVVVQ